MWRERENMTVAICLRCGSEKHGALTLCPKCKFVPGTDEDMACSLALTDHYFDREKLRQIGLDITVGKRPQLAPRTKEMLIKTIRESGVSRMLKQEKRPTGWLSRLFAGGKKRASAEVTGDKRGANGMGLPCSIVADRLKFPVTLVGANESICLNDADSVSIFALLLLTAKSGGWIGVDDFVEVYKGHLVNRVLRTGLLIPASDAANLVLVFEAQYQGDPYEDETIGRILVLFRRGHVMIQT